MPSITDGAGLVATISHSPKLGQAVVRDADGSVALAATRGSHGERYLEAAIEMVRILATGAPVKLPPDELPGEVPHG